MKVLEDVHTPFGHIRIIASQKDDTITYYQDDVFQSQADSHGISTCGYIHCMHHLMMQAHPASALVIGGAGGTLATLLANEGVKTTLVDVNAYAFTLARRYFHLPASVQCIEADGYRYLLESDERFDTIAIDAFNGKGQIPSQLTTQHFFRVLSQALSPRGLALMNIMTAHDFDNESDRIAGKALRAGLSAVLWDAAGHPDRNTLLAVGDHAPLSPPRFASPAWLAQEATRYHARAPKG